MKENVPAIVEFVHKVYGADLTVYHPSFLENCIRKRMTESNLPTVKRYREFLGANEWELPLLLGSFHISYSEFFRNPLTFSVVEQLVLPELLQRTRKGDSHEVRIWSAACAAGQEAYSMAILMEEAREKNDFAIRYRIFATDSDEKQVEFASQGKYAACAVSNLTYRRLNHWFYCQGHDFVVCDALKSGVDFSVFDLFNEQLCCPPSSIYGDFDLLLCSNLLFYYNDEHRSRIIGKAAHSLGKAGYLITGETEREILMNAGFREIYPQSAIFQKYGRDV